VVTILYSCGHSTILGDQHVKELHNRMHQRDTIQYSLLVPHNLGGDIMSLKIKHGYDTIEVLSGGREYLNKLKLPSGTVEKAIRAAQAELPDKILTSENKAEFDACIIKHAKIFGRPQ
jgi:hypothetical protein